MIELDTRLALLNAAKMHVPFDGWSDATLRAAAADCGLDQAATRAAFPRGAVDLALAYHQDGDKAMVAALSDHDLDSIRFRDRIALAVRLRLEAVEDKELVRRGMTLFALPQNAGDGSKAIWQTCDLIWTTLGDSSRDVNWYTKRATLAGVYSATVLYWLGDDSPGQTASWEFLERRIENVMQFEKLKSQIKGNKLLGPLYRIIEDIPAPKGHQAATPGHWGGPQQE